MGIYLLMTDKFNIDNLLNDQRIVKAKELINETIQEYQSMFFKAKTSAIINNENELKKAAKLRGESFFPYISWFWERDQKYYLQTVA